MTTQANDPQFVAVYGTLKSHGEQHQRMAGAIFCGTSFVVGHLFRVSWYPALVLDACGEAIFVEIYRISREMLAKLDEYEGDEYERKFIPLDVGEQKMGGFIWVWKGSVDNLERIAEWPVP